MDLIKTIYIENFPLKTTEIVLRDRFSLFGAIKKIDLPTFSPEHPLSKISAQALTKGYAFIEFTDKQSVARSCEFFNDISRILKADVGGKDEDNDRFKDFDLVRVMPKQTFLALENRYEEQRFHSMVNAAKLLVVAS